MCAMVQRTAATDTTHSDRRRRAVTLPVSGTALLLIDVINDLAFEGSQALVAQAEPMAARLATLKRRASAAGVPAIYINDNFGQWRSDFRRTVAHCTSRSSPGRRVSRRLRPSSRDYFVLKPKHSGFFDTTLDTLLDDASNPSRGLDRHRRQHLRPLHGQRRLHAGPQDLCAGRLHCLEHRRRQRPRAAPDSDGAQRKHRGVVPTDVSARSTAPRPSRAVTTGRATVLRRCSQLRWRVRSSTR